MRIKRLETELPQHTGMHKGVLKANGGALGHLYDSIKFEDPDHHSRNARHNCRKDRKGYKPWRKVGSAIKSMTV